MPKSSTILPGASTPSRQQGGVYTTISHTAWAGLPGHGPIQSKCFPIQSRGRTNTKKYRVLSQADKRWFEVEGRKAQDVSWTGMWWM